MSEVKHTPGPWLLQGRTIYALNDERIPVNRFTAHVDSGWLHDKTRISREEVDANARLIAAAPELLEAMEACYAALSPYSEEGKLARAVIAKAKGES